MKIKLSILIVTLLVVYSCKEEQKLAESQVFLGEAIGTTYSIKLFADRELEISKSIDSIVNVFNESMSTWVPNSDINKFNNGDSTVVFGKEFKDVFDQAKEVYRKTDGYFDPTVGNLVNAYGFGAKGEQKELPSQEKIDSLMQFVGFHKLEIIDAEQSGTYKIQTKQKGMYLEFNAIAKGTLVDYVGKLLDSKGVDHYVVEIGGEVITKGLNLEKNEKWSIGIDDPNQNPEGERTILTVLSLSDKAMAGSGNYRKFKKDQGTGKQVVHTVNPLTGNAMMTDIVGVNVIANNCTLADGYATAFMAMPLDHAKLLLPNLKELDVMIMHMDRSGLLRFETTPGFEKYVKKENVK